MTSSYDSAPRTGAVAPTEEPLRIRVTNLDSIHQAQNWLRHGREEAITQVVAMIRSALLLGDEIVMDRNQVLDGIVLLAIGPDDLRWHLGLAPRAPLPLAVTCAPDPVTGAIDVDAQLAGVRAPAFLSAAAAALDPDHRGPLDWLLPHPQVTPGLRPVGDSATSPLTSTRQAWAEAMRRGDLTLIPWQPIDLRPAFEQDRHLIDDRPVIIDLLTAMDGGTGRSSAIAHLDSLRPTYGDRECRRAFRWWNQTYYDAICDANDEYRISFDTTRSRNDPSSSGSAAEPSGADQDSPAPRSRWQRIRTRLSTREVPARSEIPFEGEIVDNLRLIPPDSFALLRHTSIHRIREFWERPSNRQIWDLALTVRRSVDSPWVRRGRLLRDLLLKTGLVVTVAVLLGLRDMEVLPTDNLWWLLFWAGLAFVVSVPWSMLGELGSLTPFRMTATLRIADDRITARTPPPPPSAPRTSPPEATADDSAPPAATAPEAASTQAQPGPSTTGTETAPWDEVWRAEDFDLAIERRRRTGAPSLHRITAMSGREGAIAVCRRPPQGGSPQQTLLVRVHRPAVGRDLWELPRGFGDPADPDPAHTALREYREETGRDGAIIRTLGAIHPDSGLLATTVQIVLLRDAADDPDAADAPALVPDGEIDASRWCTDAEIAELQQTGQIADALTLAALRLADQQ